MEVHFAFGWARLSSDYVQFGGAQVFFCYKREAVGDAWVAQSVKCLPSAQVMIPWDETRAPFSAALEAVPHDLLICCK